MSLTETPLMALATVAAAAATETGDDSRKWADQTKNQRDIYTQLVISLALGLSAFISFCVC
jgi:hypothetical protein